MKPLIFFPEKKQLWHISKLKCFKERYLKPTIGYSLHIEHLASCLAVSAAASRCITGSQTIDCGSSLTHSKKLSKVMSFKHLAFKNIKHKKIKRKAFNYRPVNFFVSDQKNSYFWPVNLIFLSDRFFFYWPKHFYT